LPVEKVVAVAMSAKDEDSSQVPSVIASSTTMSDSTASASDLLQAALAYRPQGLSTIIIACVFLTLLFSQVLQSTRM
jgi:hypothetical protein